VLPSEPSSNGACLYLIFVFFFSSFVLSVTVFFSLDSILKSQMCKLLSIKSCYNYPCPCFLMLRRHLLILCYHSIQKREEEKNPSEFTKKSRYCHFEEREKKVENIICIYYLPWHFLISLLKEVEEYKLDMHWRQTDNWTIRHMGKQTNGEADKWLYRPINRQINKWTIGHTDTKTNTQHN